MKFIGFSKPCELNRGKFLGNAYCKYEPKYSTSTFVYEDENRMLNHDITSNEDMLEIYENFIGDLIYTRVDRGEII